MGSKYPSEYLDTNKLTNIAHGSLLHQAFKGAVAGQPALWCVHVEGPDDILAMPTKDCAERVALKLNKGFDALNGDDLHIQAKVVPYPYSKEGFDKAMDTWADMVAEDWG